MITDAIYDTLENELRRQTKLLHEVQHELEDAPKGFLYIRDTGKNYTHYQIITKPGQKPDHKKITSKKTIMALLKKDQNKALRRICKNNVTVLKKALHSYQPIIPENILTEKKHRLLIELHKESLPKSFKKAPFDPTRHIHETIAGDFVRSKGEVIIVNALWHYGIPFNYEELFPYPDEDGNWFYPDFTIHCPDGTTIIWEHWGMLDKHSYCIHNAGKLHTFNAHNYVIGKNLILTQDDIDGNCSTVLVYHIIENYILPHFQ